jgi:MoxR-like ATPase
MSMNPELQIPPSAINPQLLLQTVEKHLSALLLGKQKEIRLALTCLVARGNLLIEDVPGVGKTTLAEGLARAFKLSFGRVQFTADLLPSDILGAQIFHQNQGTFEFKKGPIFHQLLLADELNRAPPRTQSALLEAMSQQQVSLDGETYKLPQPFCVVATQNPIDLAGTFPLPDSQLDRFLFRISLGHLNAQDEASLLLLQPVADSSQLAALQNAADAIAVPPEVAAYAVRLAQATRTQSEIERGASTRAMLSMMAAARAHALWDARTFVSPGDVRSVFVTALAHRMLMRHNSPGSFHRDEAALVLNDILKRVAAPT